MRSRLPKSFSRRFFSTTASSSSGVKAAVLVFSILSRVKRGAVASLPALTMSENALDSAATLTEAVDAASESTVLIWGRACDRVQEGSGFLAGDGHVVTNEHVVEAASEVEVSFASGFKAYGTVIGTDVDADIAVIKVDAPADQIHPLAIGDSNTLDVGEQVVAIGNPFGLNGTMTLGIVSGLGRTQFAHADPDGGGFFSTADIIQTDAAINPGNSGGPLFNLRGEVVGVNQSIRTETFNGTTGNAVNSGVGFSISINLVKRIVPYLIRDGKYEYPYLGISSARELSLADIQALGLNTYTGAYVTTVTPGGPADQAGIRGGSQTTNREGLLAGGDVITAIDGQPVATFDELLAYLTTNKSPGETVVLTILRGGQTMDVTVTLGSRP